MKKKKQLLGEAQRYGRASHRSKFRFSHWCSEFVPCSMDSVGGSARSGAGACVEGLEIQLLTPGSFLGVGNQSNHSYTRYPHLINRSFLDELVSLHFWLHIL